MLILSPSLSPSLSLSSLLSLSLSLPPSLSPPPLPSLPPSFPLPPSPSLSLSSPPDLSKRPDEVDKRAADMYSFAIVLWEIVTGKVPFASLSTTKAGLKVRPWDDQFGNRVFNRLMAIMVMNK